MRTSRCSGVKEEVAYSKFERTVNLLLSQISLLYDNITMETKTEKRTIAPFSKRRLLPKIDVKQRESGKKSRPDAEFVSCHGVDWLGGKKIKIVVDAKYYDSVLGLKTIYKTYDDLMLRRDDEYETLALLVCSQNTKLDDYNQLQDEKNYVFILLLQEEQDPTFRASAFNSSVDPILIQPEYLNQRNKDLLSEKLSSLVGTLKDRYSRSHRASLFGGGFDDTHMDRHRQRSKEKARDKEDEEKTRKRMGKSMVTIKKWRAASPSKKMKELVKQPPPVTPWEDMRTPQYYHRARGKNLSPGERNNDVRTTGRFKVVKKTEEEKKEGVIEDDNDDNWVDVEVGDYSGESGEEHFGKKEGKAEDPKKSKKAVQPTVQQKEQEPAKLEGEYLSTINQAITDLEHQKPAAGKTEPEEEKKEAVQQKHAPSDDSPSWKDSSSELKSIEKQPQSMASSQTQNRVGRADEFFERMRAAHLHAQIKLNKLESGQNPGDYCDPVGDSQKFVESIRQVGPQVESPEPEHESPPSFKDDEADEADQQATPKKPSDSSEAQASHQVGSSSKEALSKPLEEEKEHNGGSTRESTRPASLPGTPPRKQGRSPSSEEESKVEPTQSSEDRKEEERLLSKAIKLSLEPAAKAVPDNFESWPLPHKIEHLATLLSSAPDRAGRLKICSDYSVKVTKRGTINRQTKLGKELTKALTSAVDYEL